MSCLSGFSYTTSKLIRVIPSVLLIDPSTPNLLVAPKGKSESQTLPDPPSCRYTKYLIDALKRRELFCWLGLTPVRWWHALLYRDQYNYGGVEAENPGWAGRRPPRIKCIAL